MEAPSARVADRDALVDGEAPAPPGDAEREPLADGEDTSARVADREELADRETPEPGGDAERE